MLLRGRRVAKLAQPLRLVRRLRVARQPGEEGAARHAKDVEPLAKESQHGPLAQRTRQWWCVRRGGREAHARARIETEACTRVEGWWRPAGVVVGVVVVGEGG